MFADKDFEYVCGGRYDDIPAGSAKDVEKTLLDEFMQRNKGSINQLVMQFEMKKNHPIEERPSQ